MILIHALSIYFLPSKYPFIKLINNLRFRLTEKTLNAKYNKIINPKTPPYRLQNIPFANIILGSSIYDIGTSCNNIYITPQDICFELNNSGIGGDFGLIVMLEQIGFLGLITLILLFIFLKNNNLKLLKLYLLIIVSFIHYPVIFMPLGQLFIGYILSNNFNNEKKI